MPPAAKVGDVTNHGGTIAGPGEPTVLLAGMPAAVVGDNHVCPMFYSTPGPPHAATPFPMGSATVTIGGKPALRVGDVCICGAASAVGEPTIQIG